MDIRFSKHFVKQYGKLSPALQRQFDERFTLWKIKPEHPALRLHRLKGKLGRFYSINISGDLRALYEIIDDEIYIFQMIGTHSQLYR